MTRRELNVGVILCARRGANFKLQKGSRTATAAAAHPSTPNKITKGFRMNRYTRVAVGRRLPLRWPPQLLLLLQPLPSCRCSSAAAAQPAAYVTARPISAYVKRHSPSQSRSRAPCSPACRPSSAQITSHGKWL